MNTIILIIALTNIKEYKRLENFPRFYSKPLVSVLVPARNEENNIENCINSLINQTYSNYEIIFENYKKEHYFTYKKENRKIYYKEAILDVSKIGRRKVFRFKEENVEGYRYFITNDLKLTAKTAYAYIKKRWKVETMHRELK
ncbi:MAG: glycosyltransferase, partial [Candidatus Lokiarchaeota archaeon]|nr:glycosyltransferase [Candidatus Lokiarchaeota archaeon]